MVKIAGDMGLISITKTTGVQWFLSEKLWQVLVTVLVEGRTCINVILIAFYCQNSSLILISQLLFLILAPFS